MSCPSKHVDPAAAVDEGAKAPLSGREFWRSLDERSGTPQFQEALHREFPRLASQWHDPVSRRNFMKLMAASLALAGVHGGCMRPEEKIVPYVVPPENQVPGKPLFYATAFSIGGYGLGVLAEQHEGRPTKIEGNPDHPASLGATDVHAQASILSLYDPEHPETVTQAGEIRTWTRFLDVLSEELNAKRKTGGAGFRILTETITSPTLISQIQALLKQFPQARWHHYEPVCFDGARAGAIQAFGRPVNTVYRFDRADRVLSLDSDFLMTGAASVRYNRDFANKRRVRVNAGAHATTRPGPHAATQPHGAVPMSRTYAVQSTPTITATMADHRLTMAADQVEGFARAVLAQVRGEGAGGHPQADFIAKMVADLREHQGRAVVVAGEYQTAAVHAIAHALNHALGAVGQTVVYTEPVHVHPDAQLDSLRALVNDMNAGAVDMLLVLGGNPVFNAPADLKFREAYNNEKVKLRIQQSLYYDETAFYSHWHVPESHYLETWSDIRSYDGTTTIIQPLIQPLHQSRSQHELLAFMLGFPDVAPREIIREAWRSRAPAASDFEAFWMRALEKGIVDGSAAPVVNVPLRDNAVPAAAAPATAPAAPAGLEVIFRPDPGVWDGRYANNGWLQEFPRPITKLTWDNVALFSVGTARRLGITNGDVVDLTLNGNTVPAPAWIVPGHADDSVTVQLGGGRTTVGRVGKGVGFNAYRIRPSTAMWHGRGLQVTKTGRRVELACTQEHQMLEGRDHLRVHTLEQFRHITEPPDRTHNQPESGHGKTVHLSLYPDPPEPREWLGAHQWGMTIDQNVCTGCSACVVACQAENNIPVVGKEQVLFGREMHWLRIDTYYRGEPAQPEGPYFQPMLCQHCEKAPCEVVCPVEATSHSAEGINEMTYNRCIGTRYCSNNCPYKVRRFNFLQYADIKTPILQLVNNPDVTVRARGVMEKCTYCIQRLNGTRREIKKLTGDAIDAPADVQAQVKRDIDRLMDTLQTACQQSCPTEAIIFGDLKYHYADGRPTAVMQSKAEPHNYGVLTELNTQPRTTYLARLTNPNPAISTGPKDTSAPKRTAHDAARG